MIRKIITPQERTYVLELPEDFVGKEIEVLAFEVEEDSVKPGNDLTKKAKEERVKYLKKVLEPHRVDLSNFSFDRDEANNYE